AWGRGLVLGADDEERVVRLVVDDGGVSEQVAIGADDDDPVADRVGGPLDRGEDVVDLRSRVSRNRTRQSPQNLSVCVEHVESGGGRRRPPLVRPPAPAQYPPPPPPS